MIQIENMQWLPISDVDDFVTMVDLPQLSEHFPWRTRGFRKVREGMMAERDWGTVDRYAAVDYPADFTILDGFTLQDDTTGSEYEILVGVDGSNKTVIYIDDEGFAAPTYQDNIFVDSNGVTPHIRFLPTGAQRKVNLYYGSSATIPVLNDSVRIAKESARNYFYHASGTPGAYETLAAGWYVSRGGGGLIPNFTREGTAASPITETWTDVTTPTISSTGTAVTGTNVVSTYNLRIGQIISAPAGEAHWITAIADASNFTVNTEWASDLSNSAWRYQAPTEAIYDDISGKNWLELDAYVSDGVSTAVAKNSNIRIYVTVVYDGGRQESDPIFQSYFSPSSYASTWFPDLSLAFRINFANMNPNISGFRIYCARTYQEDVVITDWIDSPVDYKLIYEIDLRSQSSDGDWINVVGDDYPYQFRMPVINEGTFDPDLIGMWLRDLLASGPLDITVRLGHPITTSRSYVEPRYGAQAARPQGSVYVVDRDDRTLLLSTYDGDGNHEEDNFPQVVVDNQAQKQMINLIAASELLGLSIVNDVVWAFRQNAIEMFDLQSGEQVIKDADVCSKRSICRTPHGTAWGGETAIYFAADKGGGIIVLNPDWKNFYDGTLKSSDESTSYVTSAYRQASIFGYDYLYDELWCNIQVNKDGGGSENLNFRYSFKNKKWYIREINPTIASGIKYFSNKKDKTFTIGLSDRLLKYPDLTSGLYEDGVSSAGVSSAYGVPTDMTLNIGSLYGLPNPSVIIGFMMDFDGADAPTFSSGKFNVSFTANKDTSAWDTKGVLIGTKMRPRGVRPRGQIERLRVRVWLTLADAHEFGRLNISQFLIAYVKEARLGTPY